MFGSFGKGVSRCIQEPPKGLPPIRGIEQQIGFIFRASLPNRPAYRTNPTEANTNSTTS